MFDTERIIPVGETEKILRRMSMLERKNRALLQLLEQSSDTLEAVLHRIKAGIEADSINIIIAGLEVQKDKTPKNSTARMMNQKEDILETTFEAELENDEIKDDMSVEEVAVDQSTTDSAEPSSALDMHNIVTDPDQGLVNYTRTKQSELVSRKYTGSISTTRCRGKNKRKEYACRFCSSIFKHSSNLRGHEYLKHFLVRYQCQKCEYKASGVYKLKQHMMNKHGDIFLKCAHCKYSSNVEENHKSHLSSHLEPGTGKHMKEASRFPCDQCEYVGVSQQRLSNHSRLRHSQSKFELRDGVLVEKHKTTEPTSTTGQQSYDSELHPVDTSVKVKIGNVREKRKHKCNKNYPCNQCEMRKKKAGMVNKSGPNGENEVPAENDTDPENMEGTNQSKNHLLHCQHCSYKFRTQDNLAEHERIFHNGDKLLCDQCDFATERRTTLQNHMESKHEGVRYFCGDCDYSAVHFRTLKNHIETQHKGVKYLCDLCGFSGNNAFNLRVHKATKHDGFRYKCDQCDFSSTTNAYLTEHKEYKHKGIGYTCDQCNFTSPYKGSMKRHKIGVHGEIVHRCNQCDFNSLLKSRLKWHVKSKHEGKVHKCDECDYTTSISNGLKSHKDAVHRGIRYSCDKCDHVTTRKVFLKAHKNSKHRKTMDD